MIRKTTRNFALAGVLFLTIALTLLCCLPACTTLKKGVTQRSDSVMVHDTLRVTEKVYVHDSIYVHDTAVGIAARSVSMLLGENASGKVDTEATKDGMHLHVYDNADHQEVVDCNADSLTLVIDNLSREYLRIKGSADSARIDNILMGRYQTVTEGPKQSLLDRFWGWVVNTLALIGAITVVVFLIRLTIKKFTV